MKLTPFHAALGLSLLVHGGAVSAVYALRHEASSAPVSFHHERALEIEIISEAEIAAVNILAPVAVQAVELPKTSPPPPPENEPTALAVAEVLVPAKKPELAAAPPVLAPAVEPETKTVPQPVQVEIARAPATEMDGGIPAKYLFNPKPVYPVEARRRREEGLVVLAVQLDQNGCLGRIQIVQSSKFQMLDEAAVRAVNQWRFTPARLGRLAVASQIQVPIRFKLSVSKSNAP